MKKLILLETERQAAYTFTYSMSYIQYPLKEVVAGTLLALRVNLRMKPLEELLNLDPETPIMFPGHFIIRSTPYIQILNLQGEPLEFIHTPFESMMNNGDRDLYQAGFLLEVTKDVNPQQHKKMLPHMNLC